MSRTGMSKFIACFPLDTSQLQSFDWATNDLGRYLQMSWNPAFCRLYELDL